MQIQEVITTCAALAKLGKKPSIGLVRAKMANKVPLALIVKGIGQFHANVKLGIEMTPQETPELSNANADEHADANSLVNNPSDTPTCGCQHRVLLLEQQTEKLEKLLIDLQTQVQALRQP